MQRAILDENNDFGETGPQLGDGVPSAATALQAVFGIQQGEWGYNKTLGTPWRNGIFGKYFDAGATLSFMASTANSIRELVPFPDIEPVTAAQITLDTLTQADARQVNIGIARVIVVGEDAPTDIAVTTTA